MINVTNLSYAVDGTQILDDVDLSIKRGGITALIGPNGAGKSTLLHCISGLNTLSGGSVQIDGHDPVLMPSRARAKLVALLQQTPHVVSRLRVRDLVAFGRWPHHRGRATAQDSVLVDEALHAFALETFADRPIETLSGGQRQRAFLAMTYAQDTPWMLLDEPLNALDPKHARDLMVRLHGMTRETSRSIVIVLHDINAAAGWADHIVAMKDGRVVAHDAATTFLTPENLNTVFDTPFEVISHGTRTVVAAI